ncbi:MAG: 2-dehydro-3-deoxygalactonokinase [Cyclobacteriaceae bacterium]
MKLPAFFFSCDWGTSSFRLRLVHTDDQLTVMDELREAALGFSLLKLPKEEYLSLLEQRVEAMRERNQIKKDFPLILSGMASSSIGIRELPYGSLPVKAEADRLTFEKIPGVAFPLYLVSGLRTLDDVMRGEEVQILGCLQQFAQLQENSIIILPGTHSKHAKIRDQVLTSFHTYMSGELFSLLSSGGTLRHSLTEVNDQHDDTAFLEGVEASAGHLLNRLFSVRTRHLLDKKSVASNASFLSGLLIGSELRALLPDRKVPLVLCADMPLADLYKKAIRCIGFNDTHQISAEKATLLGHFALLKKIYSS